MPNPILTLTLALTECVRDGDIHLRIFCYDTAPFVPVYNQLTSEHSEDSQVLISKIVEHVEVNTTLKTSLLSWIQNSYPQVYLKYYSKEANLTQEVPPMSGINPQLSQQILKTIMDCARFSNQRDLRDIFVDERIIAWRNYLPEADNLQARVQAVIGFLYNKKNRAGKNGLGLFLEVLSEKIDSEDSCRDTLAELAKEILGETYQSNKPHTSIPTSDKPYNKPSFKVLQQQLNSMDDDDIDTLCLGYFPDVHKQFTGNMTKKRKIVVLLTHCQKDDYQTLRTALQEYIE